MKRAVFLILFLTAFNSFAYSNCPKTDSWLKDDFCQLTGGLLEPTNYANMKNGIFHNPFQPYTAWGNKPTCKRDNDGFCIQDSTEN